MQNMYNGLIRLVIDRVDFVIIQVIVGLASNMKHE